MPSSRPLGKERAQPRPTRSGVWASTGVPVPRDVHSPRDYRPSAAFTVSSQTGALTQSGPPAPFSPDGRRPSGAGACQGRRRAGVLPPLPAWSGARLHRISPHPARMQNRAREVISGGGGSSRCLTQRATGASSRAQTGMHSRAWSWSLPHFTLAQGLRAEAQSRGPKERSLRAAIFRAGCGRKRRVGARD